MASIKAVQILGKTQKLRGIIWCQFQMDYVLWKDVMDAINSRQIDGSKFILRWN